MLRRGQARIRSAAAAPGCHLGVRARAAPLGHPGRVSYDSAVSSALPNTANDENARYKRAIRTAEELFKKVGFRAVTMELVAREANVAKATLYSYFKNKDELYLAVCARMARLLRGGVEQALLKADASLDARLADAVIAKQRPIFALVRGSAHAAELFSYTHSTAHEIFADLDAAILEMLRAVMAEDPQLPLPDVQLVLGHAQLTTPQIYLTPSTPTRRSRRTGRSSPSSRSKLSKSHRQSC